MKRNKFICILFSALILVILFLFLYSKSLTEITDSMSPLSSVFSENSSHRNNIINTPNSLSEVRNIKFNDNYKQTILNFANNFPTSPTYYFSQFGNDKNSGLSPNNPKKDPTPYIKSGNCTVLLKSGEIFSLSDVLYVGSNIRISTFNGTERAGINFLQLNESPFSLYDKENNIYSASLNSKFKDTGWISINGNINWKKKLEFKLTQDNEYYVDNNNQMLYIKSNLTDLSNTTFSFAAPISAIQLQNGRNAIIENLEIFGAGRHGISILTYENLVVQHCYIHHIGGAIHESTNVKYGNGIQVWATSNQNIYIYNNIVSDCFDAGLTAQRNENAHASSDNIVFANNLVTRCNYSFEFFQSGTTYKITNVVVCDNIFADALDITNGYRLTMSSTNFTAHLCLWHVENPETSVYIENNFAINSQVYGISFNAKTSFDVYHFKDNTIVLQDCFSPIKNVKNYTGDSEQFICFNSSDSTLQQYWLQYYQLCSNFDTKSLLSY